MLFTIEVNNKKIKAEKGETILSALSRNGVKYPVSIPVVFDSQLLGYPCSYQRRILYYFYDFRFVKVFLYLSNIMFFMQSPCRAYKEALTTVYAT